MLPAKGEAQGPLGLRKERLRARVPTEKDMLLLPSTRTLPRRCCTSRREEEVVRSSAADWATGGSALAGTLSAGAGVPGGTDAEEEEEDEEPAPASTELRCGGVRVWSAEVRACSADERGGGCACSPSTSVSLSMISKSSSCMSVMCKVLLLPMNCVQKRR